MKRRLNDKNPERLIAELGQVLDQAKPDAEPTMDELMEAKSTHESG